MIIKRKIDEEHMIRLRDNGGEYEFELTPQEMFDAFFEQQKRFDIDSVYNWFMDWTEDDFMREYGKSRAEAESYFEEIAQRLRRNIDKYDTDFEYAISYAIEETL